MPDQEKDKHDPRVPAAEPAPSAPTSPLRAVVRSRNTRNIFSANPLVGLDPSELNGTLVVIEGMDGSGRSTQIALLQEWLESEGFSVQTSGLRRSNLVGRDIDELLAQKRRHSPHSRTDVRH